MKKTLAICLGLALILTLCGTFAGALASEVENGIDAIEDAMMKGNTNTSSFFDGMDDLREGTSADTVPTPDDFPSKYNYGSGKIQDYSRDNMLRRLSEPEGNATVLNTAADPEHIQALFLWEEDNVPTKTRFTENMTGYFDSWNFRPYVTAIPVRTGVQPKGAVVLMAGGAYQFRGNYTDSLPTAAALRELGFQTFIVDYRLSPYTQEEGALDVARAVRFVRKNASVYGINPEAIAVMGFSAGGIQAGEFLMHYDEDVTGTALDSRYVPDELDSIPAHASAAGMISNPSTSRSRKRSRRSGWPPPGWKISRRPRPVCLSNYPRFSAPFSFSRMRSVSTSARFSRPATSCRSAIRGRTITRSGWRMRRTNSSS